MTLGLTYADLFLPSFHPLLMIPGIGVQPYFDQTRRNMQKNPKLNLRQQLFFCFLRPAFKGVHGTKIEKLPDVPEVRSVSVRKISFLHFAFYFGLWQISAENLLSKLPNLSSLLCKTFTLCYQTLGQVPQCRAKVWQRRAKVR